MMNSHFTTPFPINGIEEIDEAPGGLDSLRVIKWRVYYSENGKSVLFVCTFRGNETHRQLARGILAHEFARWVKDGMEAQEHGHS